MESRANGRQQASGLLALFAVIVAVSLALAGRAEAAGQGGGGGQAASGLQGTLGLVSQQASQTAQAAGAQANAAQVQPVNIAVTVIVNSPGSKPVIVQSNGNSAGASAGNSSSTSQNSGQGAGTGSGSSNGQNGGGSGGGGSGSGGGQSQPASQGSHIAQGAGAQAGATQVQPANIATPVVVNSPGSKPVIVQTNGNSAGATAANSSSTNQALGSSQAGGAAPASQPQSSPAQNVPLQPPAIDFGPINNVIGPGTGWNLNLNLDWILDLVVVPTPQLPPMPQWPVPGPNWPFPGGISAPADETGNNAVPGGRSAGAPLGDATDWFGWTSSSNPAGSGAELRSGVSSSFVQTPAKTADPSPLPLVPLPLPPLPSPTAGGGLFSPAGLVLGAIATLALYLASLGLLLGRLGLASAPWRHQAYLSPLQRPG